MSRIPKLPISQKENKSSLLNKRPGNVNSINNLTDADKKSLLLNHTKPTRNGPTVTTSVLNAPTNTTSTRNGIVTRNGSTITTTRNGPNLDTVAASRFKRAATVPGPAGPSKVARVEKKPATVAPKIPPYDFKARFNDLLPKHKAMKEEFNVLKDKYEEVSDECEKVRDEAQTTVNERDHLKEKLLSTLKDLRERTVDFDRIKIESELQKHENEELRRQTKILQELSETLKKKSAEYDTLQIQFDDLTRRHISLKDEAEALRVLTDHLKKISIDHERLQLQYKEAQDTISKYQTDNEGLQNILASMYKEQRDLRNTVQDLKGNIRVYCRVRPTLISESSKSLFNVNVLDACSIEVEKVELNSASSTRKGKQLQSFTFDGIFTPHTSQEDVFTEVSCMIQSALDGYNVCIFAYGQTGSGKTYTMEGGCSRDEYGIIPRAIDKVFSYMEELKAMGWELNLKASFLEIYNEVIYDLLTSSKDQEHHEIKMVNSKGNDIYVSNLKEEEVRNAHEFIKLLIFAQRNRQTAATINNERSSRSHSVTQIKISAINDKRKEKFTSNLNLVDLAGSESGKFTQRMDETKHINRSLSELSKVILSLQTNQAHIPYRNSKLTHLLMPSLGGNSKTLMLVNINQLDECYSETLNSLRFATKVNNCRTVKAKKNLTMVDQ